MGLPDRGIPSQIKLDILHTTSVFSYLTLTVTDHRYIHYMRGALGLHLEKRRAPNRRGRFFAEDVILSIGLVTKPIGGGQ